MRVFNTIEDDNKILSDNFIDLLIFFFGTKGDDTLVTGVEPGASVDCLASFKAKRDFVLSAEVDNLLEAGAAGTFGNQDTVEGTPRTQCFFYGMNPNQYGHLY